MRKSNHREQQTLAGVAALFCLFCLIYYLYYVSQELSITQGTPSLTCIGRTEPKTEELLDSFLLRQKFTIEIDLANIPHPAKQHTGGEDAFFVSSDHFTFGVFDGVGGWNNYGIDAGIYSKTLASTSKECVKSYNMRDPLSILCVAEKAAEQIIGTSTACCITIDGETLYAANLGDSTFIIVRDEEIVFKSEELQHEFNFPFQIGTSGNGLDKAEEIEFELRKGDVILVGTDGLFDNLFLDDILEKLKVENDYMSRASFIANAAFEASQKSDGLSPHGVRAQEAGLVYVGGKPDDITLILAYVN